MQALIEKLKEVQEREKLNDSEFAKEKLGISRQHWQFAKAGKRKMGEKTLAGVMANLPELTMEVLMYLRRKNGD